MASILLALATACRTAKPRHRFGQNKRSLIASASITHKLETETPHQHHHQRASSTSSLVLRIDTKTHQRNSPKELSLAVSLSWHGFFHQNTFTTRASSSLKAPPTTRSRARKDMVFSMTLEPLQALSAPTPFETTSTTSLEAKPYQYYLHRLASPASMAKPHQDWVRQSYLFAIHFFKRQPSQLT